MPWIRAEAPALLAFLEANVLLQRGARAPSDRARTRLEHLAKAPSKHLGALWSPDSTSTSPAIALIEADDAEVEVVGLQNEDIDQALASLSKFLATRVDSGAKVWVRGYEPAVLPMGWSVQRSVEFHTLAVHPLPVLPPPPDIVIRSFQLGVDEESWLGANADAFSHHPDQGNLSRADLLARMNEPWFDANGFLLAVHDHAIIGFCWTKLSEDPEQLTTTPGGERAHAVDGEIYAIGVVHDAHGIGLGRALLISGLRSLAQHGATRWSLYVESDNLPARLV